MGARLPARAAAEDSHRTSRAAHSSQENPLRARESRPPRTLDRETPGSPRTRARSARAARNNWREARTCARRKDCTGARRPRHATRTPLRHATTPYPPARIDALIRQLFDCSFVALYGVG